MTRGIPHSVDIYTKCPEKFELLIPFLYGFHIVKCLDHYVDGTLVVIKPKDFNRLRNLKFTLDIFSDVSPHILDNETHPEVFGTYVNLPI